MQQVQFIQVTPEQLQTAIVEGVKTQLDELKKHLQPKGYQVPYTYRGFRNVINRFIYRTQLD